MSTILLVHTFFIFDKVEYFSFNTLFIEILYIGIKRLKH